MATDHIRYDLLAQDALRGMVRKVLTDASKSGLPGEHHFSISFRTRDEGVKVVLSLGMVPPLSGQTYSCQRQLCSGCSGRVSGLKNQA